MTLDEAIKHCEEAAEKQERASSFWQKGSKTYKNCLECAKEHRQLAAWLKELKAYRDKSQERESCDEIWERAYKEREGKKHREEAIKALKEIRDMMMNSDDWESMRRLIDAVTMGAFAIARLNEIDYGKTESEDKND